jgi:hypothetical protein
MLRNLMRPALVVLVLALCTSASAYGLIFHGGRTPEAPEIDAGLAISGLTLLVGTIAVLRARRKQ